MKLKKIIEGIFSIKNEVPYKVVRILGIKIKFSEYKPFYQIVASERRFNANEVFAANYVKHIHNMTFPKFLNCNSGNSVVITATGPTMKYYKPLNNVKHIGVNKAYTRDDIKFDYMFAYDYIAIKPYIEDIIKYPAQIFLGIYTTLNARKDAICFEHNIPMKYRNLPGINYYVTDNIRNLQHPDLSFFGLMDYGSVVFASMQFALYTNPEKIYLVGCDCSNTGYFDNTVQDAVLPEERLLGGWEKIKEYQEVYYPDTEIISVNPVGLRGLFKDVYTADYVNEHPEIREEVEDLEIIEMDMVEV